MQTAIEWISLCFRVSENAYCWSRKRPELLVLLHGGNPDPVRHRSWSAASVSMKGEDGLGWTGGRPSSCWAWTRRPAACACLLLNPLRSSRSALRDSGVQEHLGIGLQPATACAPEIRLFKRNSWTVFIYFYLIETFRKFSVSLYLIIGGSVTRLGALFIAWRWS